MDGKQPGLEEVLHLRAVPTSDCVRRWIGGQSLQWRDMIWIRRVLADLYPFATDWPFDDGDGKSHG